MLSRVADSLYWMSRYLERVEHTARLLDVNLNLMLDQFPDPAGQRWRRLLVSLGVPPAADRPQDAYNITQYLTFDTGNGASIARGLAAARENAQQVREQISSEMWEQLNQFYLAVRQRRMDDVWNAEQPHAFFRVVKEGVHLFQGITDATMTHGEGWHFIQLGRFLERAGATALLLDGYAQAFSAGEAVAETAASDYLEWVGLLKSCTAFEAYCKVQTAELRPERIAEFLLLNPDFPRSLCFAAGRVAGALQAIADAQNSPRARPLERLAGRLQAALRYVQIDEVMAGGLHAYLADIQRQCSRIHEAIREVYVAYPIESALAP